MHHFFPGLGPRLLLEFNCSDEVAGGRTLPVRLPLLDVVRGFRWSSYCSEEVVGGTWMRVPWSIGPVGGAKGGVEYPGV